MVNSIKNRMSNQMSSKYELECQLRAALRTLVPKAPGQMKKHELEHALAALNYKGEIKATIPEPASAAGTNPPRPIPTTTVSAIRVPMTPKERVSTTSSKEEKAELRKSVGLPEAIPHVRLHDYVPVARTNTKPKGVMPPGFAEYHAKRKAEKEAKEAALLAAAPAPAPLERTKPAPKPKEPKEPKKVAPPPAEEDDTDAKVVRIVRAHVVTAEKKPLGRPPAKKDTDSNAAMMAAFQDFLKSRGTSE